MKKDKVIFLLGATGCGKSDLAVMLAKDFNGEVISADSTQVFKGFNIGTAKITPEEMQGIKHYGIDIKGPDETFSAGEYVAYTHKCIEEIVSKGKLPIIAGGTGLYVKSLVNGYNFGGTERNEEFRKEIDALIDSEGLEKAVERLKSINPKFLEGLDTKNRVRVVRALEIATFGGERTQEECRYDFKLLSTTRPREEIYQRINQRLEKQVENGLIEEVRSLYEKYGYCQNMCALGYKEVLPYLRGEITIEEMKETIKRNTRHYAKRQLTFLRGMEGVQEVDLTDKDYYSKLKEDITQWLKN
ncbi:MAG: tRNA (adenosine(37)-N6)-dimethylallyltransferase MiaA [Clostridia bacterium]|nr:tRNA (adenosine(37)-N6)-dimethylallyltransferase MiaA [Clostridia bacterium]MBQ8792847.1 tRNA (adenosine(37)-N6)-dimethylallyltransferase MiaA [Clostridia bacterium]